MNLSREEDFLRNTSIYTFHPRITSSWGGVGGMKFTISCLLTLQMLLTKFAKIGPVILEKKMLQNDDADANL